MDNTDMNKLINMISKMDPKQLENGITRANELLQNSNKEELIKKIKNM